MERAFCRPTFAVAVLDTIVIGIVIAAVFAVLWTMEGPRGAIERYVSVQLLTSLSGERGHNGAGLAAMRTFIPVNAYRCFWRPLCSSLVARQSG